jgi:hypothetical protein
MFLSCNLLGLFDFLSSKLHIRITIGRTKVRAEVALGSFYSGPAAWLEYCRLMEKFAAALEPFWLKTMPRIAYTKPSYVILCQIPTWRADFDHETCGLEPVEIPFNAKALPMSPANLSNLRPSD